VQGRGGSARERGGSPREMGGGGEKEKKTSERFTNRRRKEGQEENVMRTRKVEKKDEKVMKEGQERYDQSGSTKMSTGNI